MISSNALLDLCYQIKNAGHAPLFEIGSHIGRGYADVGHEEFLLLGNHKLLSLLTGTISTLPDGHHDFFYQVLSIDRLIDLVLTHGGDLNTVTFQENRFWRYKEFSEASLHILLLKAYLALLKSM
jgi:hypothetical protein